MADYRLYALKAGRIAGVVEFDCDNDEAAIRAASSRAHSQPMELWQRARLIMRFSPADPSGESA
jgi:hypothetical protein